MKFLSYLTFFTALLCLTACQHHQNATNASCCDTTKTAATEQFASLADNQQFKDAHPSPMATDSVFDGKMVNFPVEGGANGRAYEVKATTPTTKYLMLFHEWWGLNANIKNEADWWAKELNVNVLAPDLYDGKVAATSDEAGKLMQSNDKARSAALITGAGKYAGAGADFRTMGWCFGGGWSLQAALLLGSKTKACVMYYGMPETDISRLKTLNTDVLFIHAKKDQFINDKVVADFEKNMASAGKKVMVYHYDADHAFANPSGPKYNEQAAKEARVVTKNYLTGK